MAPTQLTPPGTHGPQEPTEGQRTAITVLKVVGGILAFFTLLCIGFVFFIAVVCGSK
jgi:hypothetical protein